MLNNYDLIVHKLDANLEKINIYPCGDVHIGSDICDLKRFEKWVKMVEEDEFGYAVFLGDMIDNGLKNSKTNTYEQTMRPREQKEYLKNILKPIKGKILGVCRGNHEERTTILSDGCPLYDVMSKLDLEDLYRERMAFLKINLGKKSSDRQFSYTMALGHGGSDGKTKMFSYALEGVDIFCTGHIHQAKCDFPVHIVVDPYNEKVTEVGMKHVVVPSFQRMDGYALSGMYNPTDGTVIPVITLFGNRKGVELKWI